jgi:hypothetical protein
MMLLFSLMVSNLLLIAIDGVQKLSEKFKEFREQQWKRKKISPSHYHTKNKFILPLIL